MDYGQIYSDLIERGLTRNLGDDVYVEKHHVWPTCMGGPNEESNLVILTWPEHRLAHMLLVKMFPNNHKLVYACRAMQMNKDGRKINRKMSEWLKKKWSIIQSEANKGKKMSEESKRKMSEAKKGRTLSDEHRFKISEAGKGRKQSVDSKLKISKANTGNKPSQETRNKWSEQRKGRKLSPESILKREATRKRNREAKKIDNYTSIC